MIEKQFLLNKLTLLTKEIEKSASKNQDGLFDNRLVEIAEMHTLVNNIHKVQPSQIVELMKRANHLWRTRNGLTEKDYIDNMKENLRSGGIIT